MKRLREEEIVLCEEDTEHAQRLINFLRKQENPKYRVRYYHSPQEMLRERPQADVLLLDEAVYASCKTELEKTVIAAKRGILCTDRKETYPKGRVYKYQSARRILSEIGCVSDAERRTENGAVALDRKLRLKTEVLRRLSHRAEDSEEVVFLAIEECLKKEDLRHPMRPEEMEALRRELFHAIKGLDVLQELLEDPEITEIMVNGYDRIFIEKSGRLYASGRSFESKERLLEIIRQVIAGANRTVNLAAPIVDARLPDGSRVNAVLDPVALDGPLLTIRRFGEQPMTAEKLLELGSVTEECLNLLRRLVGAGYNILISGGTGAGKTTLLNVLSSFIPKDERIITIEDSAELRLTEIENLVRFEARMETADGVAAITIRDLIKTALRSRPDRVIVGEVRSEEAIDMLQALNIGQDGSMSTIHANSAVDALSRLETIAMLSSELPLRALRRQIASGIDIVIHVERCRDKRRRVLEVVEVLGMENEEIRTQPLFEFEDGGTREEAGGRLVRIEELRHDGKLLRAEMK